MAINIRRRKKRTVPGLNMASMPALSFTVLFFFMIVTHKRPETPKGEVNVPDGKELTRISRQPNVINLYIGTDASGVSQVQIDNHIVPVSAVGKTVADIRNALGDGTDAPLLVNIKADKRTPMGLVADVKQELRRVGALNIRYSALENNNID